MATSTKLSFFPLLATLVQFLWTLTLLTSPVDCKTDSKAYFLDLTNPLKNIKKDDFQILINTTARVGEPCDPALDDAISLIHSAGSTTDYLEAIRNLVGKLKGNAAGGAAVVGDGTLIPVEKSCFGFILEASLYRPKLMTCVEGKCQCANREPLVYTEDPTDPTGCHVVYKKLGESCTYKEPELKGNGRKSKMGPTRNERDIYEEAAQALALNPTVSKTGEIMKRFAEDTVYEYASDLIPQNIRSTCYDDDNLMECQPNGKCGCRSLEPYFQYVESNGVCVGKSKSLCYLEAISKDQETKFIFADGECANGEKCDSAVSASLIQWPVIKACGGSWGLKDDVSYSGAEGRMTLKTFGSVSVTLAVLVVVLAFAFKAWLYNYMASLL